MFSLAQISDTHLGAETALFRENFACVARDLAGRAPEVIVATGDLSLDGADREADMAYAAAALRDLPRAALCLPGNHDVGDHPDRAPRQPFDGERLARYRRHFGVGRWVKDRPGWRLLGLNSQCAGTGHSEDALQAQFIADALAGLGERRLAVFLHKPIFTTEPGDTLFDYWSVPPFARAPYAALLAHPQLRLVASGHLHLHHESMRGAARFAWAPAVSFIVAEAEQPGLPGARPCGYLLYHFGEDAVASELIAPAGMSRPYIHEVRAEAYPQSALLPAADAER